MPWWTRETDALTSRRKQLAWGASPSDLSEFRERLRAIGLRREAEALIGLVRPSCRLTPDPAIDISAVGVTRLGGEPDLPPGSQWPVGPTGPLSFIAQINLADVATATGRINDRPPGLLSVFYDAVTQSAWGFAPGDAESWSVVHNTEPSQLATVAWPDELPEEGRFGAIGVSLSIESSFPAAESFDVAQLLDDAGRTAYSRVLGEQDSPISRFLGHPQPVQGDMQVECQLASNGIDCGGAHYLDLPQSQALIPGASAWQMLLQVDSHEEIGMTWGDMGRLYFWITDRDLASQNWSSAWMVLQCY